MGNWLAHLKYDPVLPLVYSDNETIRYFTKRDLMDQDVPPIDTIRSLASPQAILKKQSPDGYWDCPGKDHDHRLLQTFKNLQKLVYLYGFDRSYKNISSACEYLFSYQTEEGDIRGFIGNQYAPYYTGIVTALLEKAGYQDDQLVEKALEWLLSMRQDDGGWVIGSPGMVGMEGLKRQDIIYLTSDKNAETKRVFSKNMPFSHSGTGMVIRAFAEHPSFRTRPETIKAARLLASHFFKEDNYNSYKSADHWIRFDYPFWWNNLLAALDSISTIGLQTNDPNIDKGLNWLINSQQQDGLWKISYSRIHKAPENKQSVEKRLWISLAVCRVIKKLSVG
jgi:hypothetical protein